MDFSRVEKLAEIMKAQGLVEVEVVEGNNRIRLAFPQGSTGYPGGMHPQPMMMAGQMPQMMYSQGPMAPPQAVPTAAPFVAPVAVVAANQKNRKVTVCRHLL